MSHDSRIQSFSAFWPYYIGEHRHPVCRLLHFVGTGGFIGVLITCIAIDPIRMGSFVVAGLLVAFLARRLESRRRALPEALTIIVLWTMGSPWVLAGIFWAYLFAWVGHFRVEGNRPATFSYPLWSLFGDFKMVGLMAAGRLWSGDPVDAAH